MLTAQEQWKIIQEKERRTGRVGRKKKTLTEQLKDMGGFGFYLDPDSEEALREDLERTGTRHPLQYSKASIAECGRSFWNSRKWLFQSWIVESRRPNSWIEEKDLPLFFRFALHRPIMAELTFQLILRAMNLQLDISMGDVRQPYTRPIGRSRQLMLGIDADPKRKIHPSRLLRRVLPKGGENMDRVRDKASRMFQEDDEDMQELMRTQLRTVYEHVQKGSVPLEDATWHYCDALNTQDMSNGTLAICLQHFGIPTDHIPTVEHNARCPSPSGVRLFREYVGCVAPRDAEERRIRQELVNYIGLYRDGPLREHEVVPMIQECLDGLEIEPDTISDILTDLDKDDETAAFPMWDDACQNESDEDIAQSLEEQKSAFRAVTVPDPQGNERNDHKAAAMSPVDGRKSHDGPATEDIDCRGDFKEKLPEQSETMSIDQPLASSPVFPPGKRPTYSRVDEAESRVQGLDTPRPKPASLPSTTEGYESQADFESDRKPFRGRAGVSRRRHSSPDSGMTTGLWGLLMPTKEARKLAYEMNLPQYAIDEVRSSSPRSMNRRKASYAKTVVTFPKSKRKASMVLHGQTPPKSPKCGDHSDIFAREGEDQETFVLSHFDGEDMASEECKGCLRLPCECVYESSPPSKSLPECSICLQQPHKCDCFRQLGGAISMAPHNGASSFDALKGEIAEKTRLKPRKQTLLSYLARVLHHEDVLAWIKQLERLSPGGTKVAATKAIFNHVRQGVTAGEELDNTGDDDKEAVRILGILFQSSPTVYDDMYKLQREIVGDRQDGIEEGPNLESSLLNSSPSYEDIPDPPLNPVASAATSPESQSKVATGPVSKANNTPLAKGISPYLTTFAPDLSVPQLESSSKTEDAVHTSRFQAGILPEPSVAGDLSRAETGSDSPTGGKLSTAGGYSSRAKVSSDSPTGSPPLPTADLGEQVSNNPVDAEGDTGCDTSGALLKKQPYSNSPDPGNSENKVRPPPPPRPGARELPSPRSSLNVSPKSTPPATQSLGPRKSSKKMNATAQSCLKSAGFDSLPLSQAQLGLPEKAGQEWLGMTSEKAREHAQAEAFSHGKSFAFYLEERRAVRTLIKKENDLANSKLSDHSFFQSSNGLSGSSGTATTSALNKVFDKYRGTSDIYFHLCAHAETIACQKMQRRNQTRLGSKARCDI